MASEAQLVYELGKADGQAKIATLRSSTIGNTSQSYLLRVNGLADRFSVWVSEFRARGTITYPATVQWRLVPGMGCVLDENWPLGEDFTVFTSAANLASRHGLLMQVSNVYADIWTLWGTVTSAGTTGTIDVALLWRGEHMGTGGEADVSKGSVIG